MTRTQATSHSTPPTVSLPPSCPLLIRTKNNTHILRASTLQNDSEEFNECGLGVNQSALTAASTDSEQDLTPHNPQSGKMRHISFNMFVE